MGSSMNRLALIAVSVLAAASVIGFAAWYRYAHPIMAVTQPATTQTANAARPATSRMVAKKTTGPATQLLEILRSRNPGYTTTRRLEEGLALKYAARILVDSPVFVDGQGYLWLTRHDAPEPFDFLKASKAQAGTQVIRETVVFVHWSQTENGMWMPHLVVKNPHGQGWQLLDYQGRRDLPDTMGLQWDRAVVLHGRIVVPTRFGVLAFSFDQTTDQIIAAHQPLFDAKEALDRAVHLVLDLRGVIAYTTNAAGTRGARGMARLAVDPDSRQFQWTVLTGKTGWPDHLVYLVPLLDGSVLQIATTNDAAEPNQVAFSINSIETAAIDERKVLTLVAQLSSSKLEKREEAFKQLTQYGPGIGPLLERTLEDADPEARIRIQMLLKNRIEPSLGGMSLVDGKMKVIGRFRDGGVLFYSEAGVAIPRPDDDPAYVTPAYLSLRPGRTIDLLPPALITDLNPDKQKIVAWHNEYVVQDPLFGPQRYIGNGLEPLLEKKYRRFNKFVGIDQTGRWIFRAALPATAPSTTPATTQWATGNGQWATQTLILDPHLPDPTPRLPGWLLPVSAERVGWDKENWPVIYMANQPKPVPWALGEFGWRVIEEEKEKVFFDPAAPPAKLPATRTGSRPSTTSTIPSTTQTAIRDDTTSEGDCLLTAPDGTRYFGGVESLSVIHPDGRSITWPLPQSAVGSARPVLLRTRDGVLFLINSPGRIIRINATPQGPQPFEVDAVFTRKVPSDPSPLRIWLDPAERICFAHDRGRITVLFTNGRISPEIARLMPVEDSREEE